MFAGDPIIVVSYDREWPRLFREQATNLRAELGPAALTGSTISVQRPCRTGCQADHRRADLGGGMDPLDLFKLPIERLGYAFRVNNPERTKRYFREPPAPAAPTSTSACSAAGTSSSRCSSATICAPTLPPASSTPPSSAHWQPSTAHAVRIGMPTSMPKTRSSGQPCARRTTGHRQRLDARPVGSPDLSPITSSAVSRANPLTERHARPTLSDSTSVHHPARQGGRCGDRVVHHAVASA